MFVFQNEPRGTIVTQTSVSILERCGEHTDEHETSSTNAFPTNSKMKHVFSWTLMKTTYEEKTSDLSFRVNTIHKCGVCNIVA
jgi:hypothetical protein